MEFYRKFYGRMKNEFKLVLFDLLLVLLTINGNKQISYNYISLKGGEEYDMVNPDYPKKFTGEHSSTWELRSPYPIQIFCRVKLLMHDCNEDNIVIQFVNETHRFCGFGLFHFEGMNPNIMFESVHDSQGGEFACHAQVKKPLDEKCYCGLKNKFKIDIRIVNGTETEINEFPMMAGLLDTTRNLIFCGSTIISNKYILTAAHCIKNLHIMNDKVKVVVGEHDVTTGTETDVTKMYRINNCHIHPSFKQLNIAILNDVAVCSIVGTIEFSPQVNPACLPFNRSQEQSVVTRSSTVTAVGWGHDKAHGRSSTTLQKVNFTIISPAVCAQFHTQVTNKEICTYARKQDTCTGDSGGPVLWTNPTTQKLVIVGIISYSWGCALHMPAVNMRVAAYLDWIVSVTPDAKYCKIE